MLVRTLEDVTGTDGEAHGEKWHTMRLLQAEDGVGVSLTDCILEAGFETTEWPERHPGACYCLEGEGSIEDLRTGKVHRIKPGTLFALDARDGQRIRASTRMRLICTFAAARSTAETHKPGR